MAQTQRFQGTARAILRDADATRYIYHQTAVVTKRVDGTIVLNSGGWKTATTRTAMNQASNQDQLGFRVFQRAHEWFVDVAGQELPFTDNMVIHA